VVLLIELVFNILNFYVGAPTFLLKIKAVESRWFTYSVLLVGHDLRIVNTSLLHATLCVKSWFLFVGLGDVVDLLIVFPDTEIWGKFAWVLASLAFLCDGKVVV